MNTELYELCMLKRDAEEYRDNIILKEYMNFQSALLIKNKFSKKFLEFMFANNFQPENYANILELIQSVPNSLSQYLINYNQFLLSKQVSYVDLENYEIQGACGYISKSEGIVVPKSIAADDYFRNKQGKVPDKRRPRYVYPSITDFDSIILYYDCTTITGEQLRDFLASLYFPLDNQFIGFVTNQSDEKLKQKVEIISSILEIMNRTSSQEHTLIHDAVSDINKEFYLIKKQKKN